MYLKIPNVVTKDARPCLWKKNYIRKLKIWLYEGHSINDMNFAKEISVTILDGVLVL